MPFEGELYASIGSPVGSEPRHRSAAVERRACSDQHGLPAAQTSWLAGSDVFGTGLAVVVERAEGPVNDDDAERWVVLGLRDKRSGRLRGR